MEGEQWQPHLKRVQPSGSHDDDDSKRRQARGRAAMDDSFLHSHPSLSALPTANKNCALFCPDPAIHPPITQIHRVGVSCSTIYPPALSDHALKRLARILIIHPPTPAYHTFPPNTAGPSFYLHVFTIVGPSPCSAGVTPARSPSRCTYMVPALTTRH